MEQSPMKSRALGTSGIEVSEVGLGLWAAGGDQWGATDDREIFSAIDAALDRGITFFDTADVYGAGHSEELLGEAMRGRRDRFIVGTKIGWRDFDGEAGRTAYPSADALIAGVESNLTRLRTDVIDVIQSHINFRDPTMEYFVEGFERLKRDGKVRAYGVSTSDFEYLKAFAAAGGCGTLQIDYSILNRTAEADILPWCREHGVGVIVRGALAMGILTGKFTADTTFGDGDFRQSWIDDPEANATYRADLETVERLRAVAPDRTLAQLALQFVLANPAVTTVIPGGKNVAQVDANAAAAALPPLTSEQVGAIDAIVAPGGGRKIWPA